MIRRNISEAKGELSQLILLAEQGEEVIICRAGKPIVRFQLVQNLVKERKLGLYGNFPDLLKNFDDFDSQIEEDFHGSQLYP